MRGDPTSEKSNLYELKMAFFDKGEPEDLLLVIRNFNITLKASGTLKSGTNIQYLHTLAHVESLRQFDALSAEVDSAGPETLKCIISGLGT